MFLFLYPVSNNLNLERHTFDSMLDTKDGIKRAVRTLIMCDDSHYYDLSAPLSPSTRFPNTQDFVTDYNDEEYDGGFWSVIIPISTKEMEELLSEI